MKRKRMRGKSWPSVASAAAAALAAAVVVPWVEARPGVRVDSPSTVVGTRRQGFDVEERPEQEVGSRSRMARDVTSSSHCQCCLHRHLSETLGTSRNINCLLRGNEGL